MSNYFYECTCGHTSFEVLSTEEVKCLKCGATFSMSELRVFNAPKRKQEDAHESGTTDQEEAQTVC